MAILTLKIDDELLEEYRVQAPNLPVQKTLESALKRFKDVAPDKRAVLLSEASRKAIEGVFGGSIEDQEKFVAWIQTLSTLNIGEIKVVLKEGQRKKCQAQATFWKQPFDAFLKGKIEKWISDNLGGY